MNTRFERPARIKRPYAQHLKIGVVFGVIVAAATFLAALALLPDFLPIGKYVQLKLTTALAISPTGTRAYLRAIDNHFHIFWFALASTVVGAGVAILFAHISYTTERQAAARIARGNHIDSTAAANQLKNGGNK